MITTRNLYINAERIDTIEYIEAKPSPFISKFSLLTSWFTSLINGKPLSTRYLYCTRYGGDNMCIDTSKLDTPEMDSFLSRFDSITENDRVHSYDKNTGLIMENARIVIRTARYECYNISAKSLSPTDESELYDIFDNIQHCKKSDRWVYLGKRKK